MKNKIRQLLMPRFLLLREWHTEFLCEVGGSNKTVLSNCGKSMLIYSILSNKKNNLKFLGKSDSNIDMVMTQITELKKHGVTLENLKTLMEQVREKMT